MSKKMHSYLDSFMNNRKAEKNVKIVRLTMLTIMIKIGMSRIDIFNRIVGCNIYRIRIVRLNCECTFHSTKFRPFIVTTITLLPDVFLANVLYFREYNPGL
jgi:hypothetical protein